MSNPTAFLIVGDDPQLVSEELDQLIGRSGRLAVDEFDRDSDPAVIRQTLSTASLFGDKRIALVKGVDGMSAEAQKQLIDYLAEPSSQNTLVMTAVRPAPRIASAVKKVGRVIDAAKGRRADLLMWTAERGRKQGLKLSGEAIAALVDAVGESRSAVSGALDELALAHVPGARLGPGDIARQFQHRPEAKLFGFIDAVAERRAGQALESLARLVAQGEAPQMLLWNLVRHFRMMLSSVGMAPAGIARDLAIQPWRAEKLHRQLRKFEPAALEKAYSALAEADKKLKKSEEPELLALERAVVAICKG